MNKLTFFLAVLLFLGLQFSSCKSVNYLSNVDANRLDISGKNDLVQDPAILALITPYKKELDKVMNE